MYHSNACLYSTVCTLWSREKSLVTQDYVHVCALAVPKVEFETGNFRGELTEDPAVPVCLSYTNTDGGFAQFSVNISVTTQGIITHTL